METMVLTLQPEYHPAWRDETPFRLVISQPTERIRLFVLSEMIPWCDRVGDEDLPLGVEVWVEKSRGLTSGLAIRRDNEHDPYIECYKLSFAGEGVGDRSYPLTLEQGDYLRRLGVEVCH